MSEQSHVVPNVTELATSVRDAASPSPPVPAMSMLVRVAASAGELALQADELDLPHYRSWRSEATCRQRQLCDYVRIVNWGLHELEFGVQSPGYRYDAMCMVIKWASFIEEACPTPDWSWNA